MFEDDEEVDGLAGIRFVVTCDSFSIQISTDYDPLFWLRVKDLPDRQIITDFNLGGFPNAHAAQILFHAFEEAGLFPKQLIVISCVPYLKEDLKGDVSTILACMRDFLQTYDLQLVKSDQDTFEGENVLLLYSNAKLEMPQGRTLHLV